MKKRIALLAERDPFLPIDYGVPSAVAKQWMGMNSGNRVFSFALRKMTLTNKTQVDFVPIQQIGDRPKEIDERYDALIYSPANILSCEFCEYLRFWTERILPQLKHAAFFVVGCGSDAPPEYKVSETPEIKRLRYQFIKGIIETGGAVALRGYYTAECLKRLGFSDCDYAVLGCPSLYMNGGGLRILRPELKPEEIRPVFNGNLIWFNDRFHFLFGKYGNSIFVCQDLLWNLLYDHTSVPRK